MNSAQAERQEGERRREEDGRKASRAEDISGGMIRRGNDTKEQKWMGKKRINLSLFGDFGLKSLLSLSFDPPTTVRHKVPVLCYTEDLENR